MDEVRVGIDVGPSRTAAVAVGPDGVRLASAVGSTLTEALAALSQPPPAVAMVDAGWLAADALTSGSVSRVAVVRIGAPLTLAIPPLATWPAGLRDAVAAGTAVVRGGAVPHAIGESLDEEAIARFLDGSHASAVAITGVFAPIAPDHELAAAEITARTLGRDVPVSLSHEFGTLGLVERENATVLNAALSGTYEDLGARLRAALEPAEVYLARGDGTLAALPQALRLPATLMYSGRAAALRGAFRLTGVDDAIVAMSEGPRLAVGILHAGVARYAARTECLPGLWTTLPGPEVIEVTDARQVEAAVSRLAEGAQRVLVAVGPEHRLLGFVPPLGDEILRPADAEFAGAIGAALGSVGGVAERMCLDREDARRATLSLVRAAACENAVGMGADPAGVTVVEVEQTRLASVPERAIIIRARAAGPVSS